MSEKYPGGFVTYNPPTPSQTSATGIWTLSQQEQYQQAGLWPYPGYNIQRSLRFNSADNPFLTRSFGTSTSDQIMTFSFWVKLSSISAVSEIIGTNRAYSTRIEYGSGGNLNVLVGSPSTSAGSFTWSTTSVYRDPSAWYHVVCAIDTTQATATNRVKLWVNGVQITSFGTQQTITQNINVGFSSNTGVRIGYAPSDGSTGAYLTEFFYVDGQALTQSSFGETNAQTGVWQPKAYSGSYGTNGFYLNFSDNSNTTPTTLGKDYSGNGNNWSPNNFSVSAGANNDSLVDVPTPYGTVDTGVGGEVRGNYATWNPLSTTRTISNGNLYTEVTGGGGSNVPISSSMALPTTGKWYWEITAGGAAGGGNGGWDWGIVASSTPNFRLSNLIIVGTTGCYGVNGNSGVLVSNATSVTTYISGGITGGAVAQVAYDADAGKLWLGKNNTWGTNGGVGNPAAGTNAGITGLSGEFIPMFEYASDSGLVSATLNMGQRPFAYTAPSGFKALCTQNLPTPTVGATSTTLAGKYFNPVLYTGNGSSQSVTGVGFQPDFVWVKERSSTSGHVLFDVIRGATKYLESNVTAAEGTDASTLTAFDSDGFSVGSSGAMNQSSQTYVGWNWKANGAGSSNTAGTITSTVSANTTSGFSVVTYTGTNANATVGHGLGVTPSMIIVKQRNSAVENWLTYHSSLTSPTTSFLYLNSTDARQTVASYWNGGPTSTVFGIGAYSGINASAGTYVAYCFAPVAGYSSMGSYTGNGSTDGPFIYTGMKPAFVIVKNVSDAGVNWLMFDTTININNVVTTYLLPNSSAAQQTDLTLDILSNGFKPRIAGGTGINQNGSSYIYIAFASNPFKYSLAR